MDGSEIRALKQVSEDMLQASRNFQGSLEHLERILAQFTSDWAAMVSRVEALEK